jgi:glyoxylase-like metal-dependent hydrolase (beta-lactamase superfamily II)
MELPVGLRVFERGWLSANNILLVDDDRTALVDTGYWTHEAQTVKLVEKALPGRSLDVLINTHLHSDHCGGNASLQARYPAVLTWIPPGLESAVRRWDPVALTYEPTGQYCPRFRTDGVARPGDCLRLGGLEWEVHAAPGHDPHGVVLFERRDRILISADALWQNGFGVVFPELEGEHAFDLVAGTLDVIESLRPAIVIPGHGPVFTDVAPALERSRRRLDAYVRDPVRHAAHAAKVLIKFKLLERQSFGPADLLAWVLQSAYFSEVHRRYFGTVDLPAWVDGLVDDLVRSGAAARTDRAILNA